MSALRSTSRWSSKRRRRRCSRSSAARPANWQPVFATMLENAVRICDAKFGNIYRWDGHEAGTTCEPQCRHPRLPSIAGVRHSGREDNAFGRMIATKTWSMPSMQRQSGLIPSGGAGSCCCRRTWGHTDVPGCAIAERREFIGAIRFTEQEVRPFTDKQIELVRILPPRPSSPSRTRGC